MLRVGFRPFFLGAGVFAAFAILSWVSAFSGVDIIAPAMAPKNWHAHEMVFGYAAAVITGFLLTAIPNWTGRLPIAGWPLGGLFGLWLAARIAMALSDHLGVVLAALLDTGFLVVVTAMILREITSGRNWRNLPVCIAIGLLAVASALSHLEAFTALPAGIGMRFGIATVISLIALIGGRIIPSFTRNWMAKSSLSPLPAPFARFDRVAIASAILALVAWTMWPDALATGGLLALAAVIHFARLSRWRGIATGGEPLVTILHIGYLWLPVGFALLGASILAAELVPRSVALHGLTAGAIAVMTIAVMTRATLGHSGQPLRANGVTVVIYALINLGAALRIVSVWLPVDYGTVTLVAGVLWGGGFLLFALAYGPYLLGTARPPAEKT